MAVLRSIVVLLGVSTAAALRAAAPVRARTAVRMAAVDPFATVSTTLSTVEETRLLSKVARLGLLSKLEKAGLKLSDIEPLLVLAEKEGLIGALGEVNDDLLPLLPTLVGLAPAGLPALGLVLNTPPAAFYGLAAASAAAGVAVTQLPDDSVGIVALQTFVAILFGGILPVVFGGLGVATSKLSK